MAPVAASYRAVEDVLVGRAGELDRLNAELDLARSGRPRVVTVEGAAGVGKTALVRDFLARSGDVAIVDATAAEWESCLPFGVVAQLLSATDDGDGLGGFVRAGGADDALVVGARLLDVVGRLAADRPLVLLVDDAQWVDVGSVHALCFALRRLRVDAVLALFVGRDDGPGVPELFGRLSSDRGCRVRLGGLDADDLSELATATGGVRLSRRAAARLAEHTGGNPLYARALLEELGAGPFEAVDGALPAPGSYALVVLARLAGCSEPARRLVEAASVLGPVCPIGLAARVGEVAEPLVALEEAVAAHLVCTGPDAPGQVRFAHPLTRAAVYHHLGPARRAALHARAATVVDLSASLAHRVAAAVGEDAALAAELEAQGRLEAERGALNVAAGRLLDAARLNPDPVEVERVTLDAVELLLSAGDVAQAARVAAGRDRFPRTARREYLLGHLAVFTGRGAEAERLLVSAWDLCEGEGDKALASLVAVDMARLCGGRLRAAEAAEWARRAIDTSVDAEVTAAALGVLVPCLGMIGRSADALAALASGSEDDDSAPIDVEALLARGTVRLWVDDLAEARADLAAVVERCRDRPAARPALIALAALADAEYRLGAWDDSVTHATQAVSLAEDSDQRWMGAFVHSAATWVLAPRGDWPRAEAHAAAALQAAGCLGDPMSLFCAYAGNAHVASHKGEHQRVVDALQPLYDNEIENVPEEPGVHPWRHLHAEALLRLGRLDDAAAAVEVLERLAREGGRRSSAAHAARLRAQLAAEAGDPEQARHRFEDAVGAVEQLNTPFEVAQTHEAFGRFLRRLGERREAAAHLETALTAYHRLGAHPLAASCAGEMAACGLNPRRRGQDRTVDLTPQELAIARLVATGATNREVAADLVVSVKTVEHHLSSIYAKLGVRSRTQLASRLNGRPD